MHGSEQEHRIHSCLTNFFTPTLCTPQNMLSKIIVATALGLAAAQSGSGSGFGSGSGSGADTTLPDCECQTSWTHNECE